MESSKLKNIILTILLITNALLLGLMIFQEVERRQFTQKTLDDAVALLAQQGISVRAEDLPREDFPAPMVLERDAQWELQRFTELLGEGTGYTQRGLVSIYEGPLGRAEVQSDGAFTVDLAEGAYPAQGEETRQWQEVLRTLGFSWRVQEASANDGASLTLCQWYSEGRDTLISPVFSCQAVLSFDEQGALRTITGTRLAGKPTVDDQAGESLSTATLLVRFRANIIDSGDACNAILAVQQGYVLSGDANGKLRLTPVLRMETDTNLYIVNALNGELRRA